MLSDKNLAAAMDLVFPGQPAKAACRLEESKTQRNTDYHIGEWPAMIAAMKKARQTLDSNPFILADLKQRDVVVYRSIFMQAEIRSVFGL